MDGALKIGFIPEEPVAPPPLHIVTYKPSDDPRIWASACRGPMEVISFCRAADRNRSPALMRFFKRKLNEFGFSEDAVARLAMGLAEAIPNAMIYGLPGSRVGVVLVITGRAPNRNLLLMVSNFIAPGTSTPDSSKIPNLEDILFETHGRGTGILKVLADEIGVARSENYDLLTVVHFTEQLP